MVESSYKINSGRQFLKNVDEIEKIFLSRDGPARLTGNPKNNNQTIKLKFHQTIIKTINIDKKQ